MRNGVDKVRLTGGEPLVAELLQQMTPERALVQLTAQELKPQAPGPWHVTLLV